MARRPQLGMASVLRSAPGRLVTAADRDGQALAKAVVVQRTGWACDLVRKMTATTLRAHWTHGDINRITPTGRHREAAASVRLQGAGTAWLEGGSPRRCVGVLAAAADRRRECWPGGTRRRTPAGNDPGAGFGLAGEGVVERPSRGHIPGAAAQRPTFSCAPTPPSTACRPARDLVGCRRRAAGGPRKAPYVPVARYAGRLAVAHAGTHRFPASDRSARLPTAHAGGACRDRDRGGGCAWDLCAVSTLHGLVAACSCAR